jgi:hypothetical protein
MEVESVRRWWDYTKAYQAMLEALAQVRSPAMGYSPATDSCGPRSRPNFPTNPTAVLGKQMPHLEAAVSNAVFRALASFSKV